MLSAGFDYVCQDAVNAKVILADGTVWQADLIIAANGVHSTAREHVLDTDETNASNTGWATMRWLLPTDELLADANTAPLVEYSTQRYFMGAQGGGLVWYQCRKYVPDSPLLRCLRKLLIFLGSSNEVQNFLYLSQSFASSNITEGMHT